MKKRALLSVSDKSGIQDFARGLVDGLKTREQFEEVVSEEAGVDEAEHSYPSVDWRSYFTVLRSERALHKSEDQNVGVVVASGEILDGKQPPGTVGGALAMNAGCYGAETWDSVERVLTVDRHGAQRRRAAAEFAIGYRHCALKDGTRLGESEWFAAAWFRFAQGDGAAARARIKDLLARRVATQPLALPNAGSVFRNPPQDHAARLIEACGLKGLARGGARVSEQHANFIVNPKGAGRASDIEWLIETVRSTVRARTGVDLIAEVRIVGEPG